MPSIDINDLGRFGAIQDTPAYMLPPEAVSLARNMRIKDGGLEKLLGWSSTFGTPGVAPHFVMPVRTAAATFWLYVSLTKAYGYDGTSHTDITRSSGGNYAAASTQAWNGTLLGGVPIVNNGTDVPQFWPTITLGTQLAALTNWPAGTIAAVIRAFGPFLMAFNVTKSGTNYPHMVKWSHPAVPGAVPSSWDETDPATDAGELDLPDTAAGILRDALPLGDTMFAYKDSSTWRIRYIGGQGIFDPGKSAWLTTSGILAARCVAITKDGLRQVVATQDDIIQHDGVQAQSVLNQRQRRRLFNDIDTTAYATSFMFDNPFYSEMWFCYPSAGASQPDSALILNYGAGSDAWPITEVSGITFRNAVAGPIESASGVLWSTTTDTWDSVSTPWSQLERRRVICCGTDASLFYKLDESATRNGSTFTGTVQRIGLSLIGRKRSGEWIVDFQKQKLATRMWPKIQGGPVSVRLGSQAVVNGATIWTPSMDFDPGSTVYVDLGPISGRALGFEIASDNPWRIDGYKFDLELLGDY